MNKKQTGRIENATLTGLDYSVCKPEKGRNIVAWNKDNPDRVYRFVPWGDESPDLFKQNNLTHYFTEKLKDNH